MTSKEVNLNRGSIKELTELKDVHKKAALLSEGMRAREEAYNAEFYKRQLAGESIQKSIEYASVAYLFTNPAESKDPKYLELKSKLKEILKISDFAIAKKELQETVDSIEKAYNQKMGPYYDHPFRRYFNELSGEIITAMLIKRLVDDRFERQFSGSPKRVPVDLSDTPGASSSRGAY